MIEAQNITKNYGLDSIIEAASFRVSARERVGIIGPNGAGKTTLVRMLLGLDDDFTGTIQYTENERTAFVAQDFQVRDMSVLSWMVEDFSVCRRELADLETAMAEVSGRDLERVLERYGELRSLYDARGGDEAEERAYSFLSSIKLDYMAETPLGALSGGERNVIALGRAFISRPDVLVLDEPGNHLDVWGLAWLEQSLREYPGCVLIVSHNRYLLDRVCTRILDIERSRVSTFSGNYSAWRIDRLKRAVSGEMAFRADQKKIERLEEIVKRFTDIARRTADPAWGRRLRARKTHLEKTREAARGKPSDPVSSYSVSFAGEASRAHIALKVDGLSCGFGERLLFSDVSLTIPTGERVALVGPNGSGKTTFIREVLARHARGESGVYIGPSLNVAYCSQHAEWADGEATVLDECIRAGALTEDEAWKALSPFLFKREALGQRLSCLSGGEKNRLQLVLAVIAKANFLILDEPTNHLDIASCEAIEEALLDFPGTLLVVSHDRYFLDRIATRVLEITGGTIVSHDGNFSEFWFSRYGTSPVRPVRSVSASEGPDPLEKRIVALEAEQKELEGRMESAWNANSLDTARVLGTKLERVRREIDRLYAQWE